MNSNQISKAVRLALVAGAVSAVAAPAAFAADATQSTTTTTTNQNTAQLGKIEVTGTRIKRTDVETAQPVTILTATQLKQTGLTSIGDILQTVTQAGAALNTTFNNGGNGSTNIDLRFLGANRVLVLVNGRRWTPALNGTVDLNTIPVSIIDHVEILQDGASAIYGSDAIAGVINIITVRNYNGAEANAYQSFYSGEGHHDGKVQEYDFTIGSSGDKSGVVLNVGYVNQHEIWAGNRDISKEPIRGLGLSGGSSAAPNGRFFTIPTASGACPTGVTPTPTSGACDMTLKTPGTPSLSNFRNWTGPDHYNFAPLNYFVTPNERTSFYTEGHYDLADNLTFTTSVLFNKRSSEQALASSPLFLGLAGSSFVNGQPIGVGAANPYNPFGKTLNGNTATWNPATQDLLVFLGRRPVEAGLRLFDQNVQTSQFSSAFKGYFNLGGNEWDWDLGYTYGDNYESDVTNGLFNTERLATALDSPGVASCKSQPNCVPFNIFGGAGSVTPAMLNYVLFEEHDVSDRQMRDYTGNINGSLADLPAGPLGMALGYEYLEFNGFQHPDATVSSGNTSGNVTQPTDGRQKTAAEYIEFDFPLVADAPGFKMLDLDVANRWSQFQWKGGIPGSVGPNGSFVSHFAHASTGRAALKWQPTDSLLIRASWSQGFRAPSISDLFFGNSDSFPSASDPCATKGTLPAGCLGVKHTQPNQQIRSTVGGNKGLVPEHATSKSIGFVWNPDFIPGFDFSLDYYHIELDKQVTAIPVQTILNGCYINSNTKDCSYITVKGGIITDIMDTNVNIGGIVTSGYDVAAHYKFPSTSVGDFKLGMDWTFLKFYNQTLPDSGKASGFSTNNLAGTTTGFGGFPKQRANVYLNWNYGDWSASWNMEYIHAMYEGCSETIIGAGFCSAPGNVSPKGVHQHAFNHLGNTIYHDVQATYHFDDWNTDFTFGIRNLFDKAPPTAETAFANSFLPAFYRVPGREFYGRISVKF
ncbi:MAG TPA: TonB-dependent receptor [Gammaproteobacteria bacterium]|nr:TonB-dependent receptor [Gammaproteobacteria bacterium]